MNTSALRTESWLRVIAALGLVLAGCTTPPPSLMPTSGAYTCPQEVTIADAKQGAEILYTTDGSSPTPSSKRYTGPISVSSSNVVQAIAVAPGASVSAVSRADYACTDTALTRADFAIALAQQFDLPQPREAVPFADVQLGDAAYHGAQAIAPFMHRKLLCPGCRLSLNYGPTALPTRSEAAITIVSILVALDKITLVTDVGAGEVLGNAKDASALPPAARRHIATALSNGVLRLRPGNTIEGSAPFDRADMSATFSLIRQKFHFPEATSR